MGTVIVTVVLVLAVAGIVVSLVRDKKHGKTSCGGNCANCRNCQH